MRIITAEKFSSEDFRFVNPTCGYKPVVPSPLNTRGRSNDLRDRGGRAMEDVTQATYDYRALAKSPAF
jgi:hypothetical protein